ncbi:MAG: alpha/beta fold hydrolase [Acidobacteriaceae bacterium]|jgi:dienelactone hydrolase
MRFTNRALIGAALSGILFGTVARAQKQAPMTTEQRQEYRDKLLKILPPVPDGSFDAWIKKTNALPPDFNSLPRQNLMPDPLTFFDGRKVTTAAQWAARREEISKLEQKYVWGTFPPKPKISKVNILDERHDPNGYLVRNVSLVFGPGDKATMRVRVYIPDGKGPFPVMIGTSLPGWASTVIPRGYIAAGYAGNDAMDDMATLGPLYPDNDFATLPRRAWAASLVVDYLDTLPQVDQKHIAITGYSRDGKMVAIAAAMDTRIAAVVAGSTGVGGVLPWRATGERGFGEGIESTTRSFPTWFAPQLRFFAGREDRLPVDGNSLAAMIAPRSILMVFGKSDQVSSSWGNEQTYYTALKVFKLLGVPDHIATLMVPGFHGADDREADMDWLDQQFGRSDKKWTNNLIFQWDWAQWKSDTKTSLDLAKYPAHKSDDLLKSASGGTIASVADWEKKAEEDRKVVLAMLGPTPLALSAADSAFRGFGGGAGPGGPGAARPGATGPGAAVGPGLATAPPVGAPGAAGAAAARRGGGLGFGGGAPAAPIANVPATYIGVGGAAPSPGQLAPNLPLWVISNGGTSYGWLEPEKSEAASRHVMFNGLAGDLYYPKDTPAGKKLPTVIWLHGYSYPLGYMWVYHSDLHPILALVHAGYAVLAYDQSGFGSRLTETGPFYQRFPQWSHMGRLVEDAHSAVTALTTNELVDPNRIYLFGYSLGGNVAMYEAALDPRVKGIVSVAGFTPMRTDTPSVGDGGVARYATERDLIPKLGFFIGHEAQIPYDYQDLLGMIAPRPVLVVEPQLDRDATPKDVEAAVNQAKQVYTLYGAGDKLAIQEPWDYNRLPNSMLDEAVKWMTSNLQ